MWNRVAVPLCLLVGWLLAVPAASAAEARAELELLHNVPSTVIVSSSVRNGKNQPEHLVDGQLDTAWNSQPGVADRSYIDFVVPSAAQVRVIKMTVGFTSQNEKGDLFPLNYRISQVQVFRNRVSVGTFALDKNSRGLQELLIDKPGGHYRIQILRIVPGKNTKWSEVCVSELQVYGSPPPGIAPKSQAPTVFVGGVIAPQAAAVATIAAFCEKWERHVVELKLDLEYLKGPYCREKNAAGKDVKSVRTSLGPGQSPFLAAQLVEIADSSWDTLLALRTPKGWFLYPIFSGMDFESVGCSGYDETTLLELRGTSEQLALRYRVLDVTHSFEEDDPGRRVVTEYKVVCTPGDGADGTPLCLKQLVSRRWSGDRY